MKACDLMIGDWVKAPQGPRIVTIIGAGKVGLLHCGFTNFYYIDEIEPIPLTQEILEKNGFEVSRRKKYFLVPNDPSLAIKREPIIGSHGNTFFIGHFVEENHFEDFIEIAYLHELQHAIRLCGIDNEIEL